MEKLVQADADQIVLRLSGKLSLETVAQFILAVKAETSACLILDMSGVSFLDSAGVGALVQVYVHQRNAGKKLALTGLTMQGQAIMQVAGLSKLLPIYKSVEEALTRLK